MEGNKAVENGNSCSLVGFDIFVCALIVFWLIVWLSGSVGYPLAFLIMGKLTMCVHEWEKRKVEKESNKLWIQLTNFSGIHTKLIWYKFFLFLWVEVCKCQTSRPIRNLYRQDDDDDSPGIESKDRQIFVIRNQQYWLVTTTTNLILDHHCS